MQAPFKGSVESIFLLFLAIMGSVGFKLLGCPLQNLLHNNVWARQITYFIVVLFTSSFLSDGKKPPVYHFLNAIYVYLFLLTFTKMTVRYAVIIFFLILFIYVSDIYIKYFKDQIKDPNISNNDYYRTLINNLNSINNCVGYITISILVFGFSSYLVKKHQQYGNKFNIIKFIFGVRACKQKNFKK